MSEWIIVRHWDQFQHFKNRDPIWIRNYVALTADEDYLGLSGHRRAVLHGLWLEYARSDGRLVHDTATISRRLALKVTTSDLEALNHAGFIEVSDIKPISLARARATRAAEAEAEAEKKGSIGSTSYVDPARARSDNGAAIEQMAITATAEPRRPSPDDPDAIAHALQGSDGMTVQVLRRMRAKGLPPAAFARAWESLETRRADRTRPTLESEARYYVAALRSMIEEQSY